VNVRRPRLDELADVIELMRAADLADAGVTDWEEDDLRRLWSQLDLEQDAWVVELDGTLAGYLDVVDRGAGRVIGDGYVHPALRGRGVGPELLRLAEAWALETSSNGRVYLQLGTVSQADALFAPRGYGRVRSMLRMVAELDSAPAVDPPAGVELRALRSPDEDRAAHEALEQAFAGHWEHRRLPFDEYAERTFAREDFDASLCPVAVVDGELVGASLNWWKHEGDWGWIGTLGVVPASRRRGIAEALARWSFAQFFGRGERRVALGVDALNETGAVRLYERLGMRRFWEAAVWEKELRHG
jgi:mycothiol synthase